MQRSPEITRRDFLALSIAASLPGCVSATLPPASKSIADDLAALSATDAVTAMRNGDIGAEKYAGALLRRCDERRDLNAFISLDPQRVLEAAREADKRRAANMRLGPLHGLPVPVKDSVNTTEYPTTGGTPALRDFYPSEDAAVVTRLREAGCIVLGKTNLHELSFGWTSNNLAFGPVHNPYDTTRIPGGSSGGTAAAVAAGMAPLGVAEDTTGSIRVPAGLCGICGFRPTTGRYPNGGVLPLTTLFDQVGPHARNVRDLALFDHVVTNEPLVSARDSMRDVRLGVSPAYFLRDVDPDVYRIFQEAMKKLTDAGAVVVTLDVPDLKKLIDQTTAQIELHDTAPELIKYLANYGTGVSLDNLLAQASVDIRQAFAQYVLPGGEFTPSEADYIAARDVHRPALRQTLRYFYARNRIDALIFPMAQIAAVPIGQDEVRIAGKTVSFEAAISRNILPASGAGLPGLVLPAGLTSAGLPVAIELDGPEGSDRSLLGVGQAVERVLGPLPRPPEPVA